MKACSFNGCERLYTANGLCSGHYQLARKGKPLRPLRPPPGTPNEIVILGTHAEIVLTGRRGLEKMRAIIDVEDVDRIRQLRWWCSGDGYVRAVKSGMTRGPKVSLHRLIMDAPVGMEVDHWNGNPMDNRKGNLRLVTRQLNGQNLRITTRNSSGYRGVFWNSASRKWQANIEHLGRCIYVGQFDDVHEAGHAAHEARERIFENHQTRPRYGSGEA